MDMEKKFPVGGVVFPKCFPEGGENEFVLSGECGRVSHQQFLHAGLIFVAACF